MFRGALNFQGGLPQNPTTTTERMTMSSGTNYASAENQVATSDARFDMRLTENFDDDASGTGWTWVAAILIAGVLIVSGYLDQEAGIIEGKSTSTVGERYASNVSAHQPMADTSRLVHRADKGY